MVDEASEAEVLMFSDDKTYIQTRTSLTGQYQQQQSTHTPCQIYCYKKT